jgi:hypothetical protein
MATTSTAAVTAESIADSLSLYFPTSFAKDSGFLSGDAGQALIQRLSTMPSEPITQTHLNQLLHLAGEHGVSPGFFKYYFLSAPLEHFYSVKKLLDGEYRYANPNPGITSLQQLRFGLHRFFIDALLCFGDVRHGYTQLSEMDYGELAKFFDAKRYDWQAMRARGPVLPFRAIPADDRYLIAELACKAYSPIPDGSRLVLEDFLVTAYRNCGGGKKLVSELYGPGAGLAETNPQAQYMLEFTAEEFAHETVASEGDICKRISLVAARFKRARELALANTRLYLSIVNELDVYVATSMRKRSDFRDMSRDCDRIFKSEGPRSLHLRYFDPTISAADRHEDKGIIECLMVKCAKALVYFAGEADSFGKDSEVSAALSLGKPVVILCPPTAKGDQRMQFFRDVHPLSRMVNFDSGVVIGAMVTNDPLMVAELLTRIFTNTMEYDLDQQGDGYFKLRERLTHSVVRLQTNDRILRESFWNYYHHEN